MIKIALAMFLISLFSLNADFEVKGNIIYVDKRDGSPVIAIKIEEISKDPVYIEWNESKTP